MPFKIEARQRQGRFAAVDSMTTGLGKGTGQGDGQGAGARSQIRPAQQRLGGGTGLRSLGIAADKQPRYRPAKPIAQETSRNEVNPKFISSATLGQKIAIGPKRCTGMKYIFQLLLIALGNQCKTESFESRGDGL